MVDERAEGFGVRQGARTTQRRGRMTAARHAVLAELGPAWLLDPADAASPEALTSTFAREAPRLLDIGAGNGEASRAWALVHPDHDVVAVDLHRPGLARLVKDLHEAGPPNVRAVEADALLLLEAMPAGSLAEVRVLFPDPWPKRRHVGRRLVDPSFVRLAAGGPAPSSWAGPRWRTARPERPVTAYEQRGLDAGRAIADLVAVRRR